MARRRFASISAVSIWVLCASVAPRAADAAQFAQAASSLAGDWAAGAPCSATPDRLRFAGNTLTVFVNAQRAIEYEVEIAPEANGILAVRVVSLVRDSANGAGTLPPGSAIAYRQIDADTLRLAGIGMPGGAIISPTVATVYRRCK